MGQVSQYNYLSITINVIVTKFSFLMFVHNLSLSTDAVLYTIVYTLIHQSKDVIRETSGEDPRGGQIPKTVSCSSEKKEPQLELKDRYSAKSSQGL